MAKVITTLIDDGIAVWLQQIAKNRKQTKRSIIETALNQYRHSCKTQNMQQSFCRAAKDSEIVIMSEIGLDDYQQQLQSFPFES